MVPPRVVVAVVDAHAEGQIHALGVGGDDHPLHPPAQMVLGQLADEALSGRVHDNRGVGLVPGDALDVELPEGVDLAPVDQQPVAFGPNLAVERTVDAVVGDEAGELCGAAQIVDRHELETLPPQGDPQERPPDASQPVDGEPDRHGLVRKKKRAADRPNQRGIAPRRAFILSEARRPPGVSYLPE